MGDEPEPITTGRTRTPSKEELQAAIATLQAALEGAVLTPAATGEGEERPVIQRVPVHAIGPGAAATGHGLAGGGRRRTGAKAYEKFIEAIRNRVGPDVWDGISMEEQASWVKLEGKLSGERVYIARTVNTVSRVESTLPPEAVPGCTKPDRMNGSILSWVPANEETCAEVVTLIATLEAPLEMVGRR